MPTQKIFKQRIRARMTKTGESYTAARRQLLRHAGEPDLEPRATEPPESTVPGASTASSSATDPGLPTTDGGPSIAEALVVKATGKGRAEWFDRLDVWGATERTHTEIARWLREVQGTPPWWTQAITVDYERARGMRSRHQMRDGFSVSMTKTVATDAEHALAAFTDPTARQRWLPDAPLTPRPTRAVRTARFDWADPESRVVVVVAPKDAGRLIVSVTHERIADAAAADALKVRWRAWLSSLKATLERA